MVFTTVHHLFTIVHPMFTMVFTIVHPLFTRVFTTWPQLSHAWILVACGPHECAELLLMVLPDVLHMTEPEDGLSVGTELAGDSDVLSMPRGVPILGFLHLN